ncbi:gluconate 2-dehydrogenase subunit 3 family protein [Nocardioides islandensis]|nr:gluconate 2-dehydrogenase subunit 3 family protein [Nocardioides islandensis]
MSDTAPGPRPDRFPGFDVLDQSRHWDSVTTGVVLSRIEMPPDIRFFTPDEQAVAAALCDQLLDQHGDPEDPTRVPVVNLIDSRLAEQQTDGWRYQDMPEDAQAWRDTLAALDREATNRFGVGFAAGSRAQQAMVIQAVQDLGSADWHGLVAQHVWSLWSRYACTAFYSHPSAWNEIGFPGPAYPRGYKNPGVDSREPFEVPDAFPDDDPVRSSR